ncbi:MAG: hypothetical protein COB83_09880 [Gammaproteobacteria bacterium]|nr:MAG: hypothetical protein COB83_09880 [Gammaproteobacteria bacterium]
MGMQVAMGASLMCTMGVAPSSLIVLPQNKVLGENKPAANIMDNKPFVNIMPFGMCKSPANPAVAAATAAALGVLTPMPCTPVTPSPWAPGSPTVVIANFPALNNSSKCMCAFAGTISITNPGCTKISIP